VLTTVTVRDGAVHYKAEPVENVAAAVVAAACIIQTLHLLHFLLLLVFAAAGIAASTATGIADAMKRPLLVGPDLLRSVRIVATDTLILSPWSEDSLPAAGSG
jgi:hypothetical protein